MNKIITAVFSLCVPLLGMAQVSTSEAFDSQRIRELMNRYYMPILEEVPEESKAEGHFYDDVVANMIVFPLQDSKMDYSKSDDDLNEYYSKVIVCETSGRGPSIILDVNSIPDIKYFKFNPIDRKFDNLEIKTLREGWTSSSPHDGLAISIDNYEFIETPDDFVNIYQQAKYTLRFENGKWDISYSPADINRPFKECLAEIKAGGAYPRIKSMNINNPSSGLQLTGVQVFLMPMHLVAEWGERDAMVFKNNAGLPPFASVNADMFDGFEILPDYGGKGNDGLLIAYKTVANDEQSERRCDVYVYEGDENAQKTYNGKKIDPNFWTLAANGVYNPKTKKWNLKKPEYTLLE